MFSGERFPNFLTRKDIIIASSYRKLDHLIEVRQVSNYFYKNGQEVYPAPDFKPVNIDDDFVFLGGLGEEHFTKREIERLFLEAIRETKLLYVVATNGYMGQSASTELAYGLAVGTPTVISQRVTSFGEEVNPDIKDIVKKYHPPIAPIHSLRNKAVGDLINEGITVPTLTKDEKLAVFGSLLNLARTLRE